MYGKIFLYLTSEDILELVLVTKTLRVVFENEDEKIELNGKLEEKQILVNKQSGKIQHIFKENRSLKERVKNLEENNRLRAANEKKMKALYVETNTDTFCINVYIPMYIITNIDQLLVNIKHHVVSRLSIKCT